MHIIDDAVFKSMKFHVHSADGEPCAALHHADHAAALVSVLGEGACVADPNGTVLWSEGEESFPAGESYDEAAELMHTRLGAKLRKQ